MGGAGAAPPMKMSDIFILIGVSILVGGLFIHGLSSSKPVPDDAEPFANGASLLKQDSIEFSIETSNDSVVSIEIQNEGQESVFTDTKTVAGGGSETVKFTASEGGFFTYSIEFVEGSGDVYVDVDRNLFIDFIIYPIGALFLLFGFYKRKDEQQGEALDAVLESPPELVIE